MTAPRWFIGGLIACLVILTLGTASKALAADRQPLPIEAALAICRAVYFSGDPAKALAVWKSLPEDEQASVALICLAYRQGARDLMRASRSADQPRKG